jgi:hypothetical protein
MFDQVKVRGSGWTFYHCFSLLGLIFNPHSIYSNGLKWKKVFFYCAQGNGQQHHHTFKTGLLVGRIWGFYWAVSGEDLGILLGYLWGREDLGILLYFLVYIPLCCSFYFVLWLTASPVVSMVTVSADFCLPAGYVPVSCWCLIWE